MLAFTPAVMQSRGIDALLENLALRCLRITEIHHLIHELVYNDEVVADRLLFKLLEVFDKYGDKAVEEEDDLGGI